MGRCWELLWPGGCDAQGIAARASVRNFGEWAAQTEALLLSVQLSFTTGCKDAHCKLK